MAVGNLNFRLATVDDAAELERLINTAFRNDKTTQVFLSPEFAAGIEIVDVPTLMTMITQPDVAVLVATDADGAIVAHCSVRKLKEGVAWFGLFAVDVRGQSRGFGSQVLARAEEHARQGAYRRMEFEVVCTRVDLIAWYTHRGYRPTGETRPFPYDRHGDSRRGLRDDLHFIIMGKDLIEAPTAAGAQ